MEKERYETPEMEIISLNDEILLSGPEVIDDTDPISSTP